MNHPLHTPSRAARRAARSGALSALLLCAAPALATHIAPDLVLGTRTPLPGEGYLSFLPDPGSNRFGDEWTGWIDVRHPSLAGPRNSVFGYARSDHFVTVQTTVLRDNRFDPNLVGPPDPASIAQADRVTDFEYANRAYVYQAGLSVIETSNRTVTSPAPGQPGSFRFPLRFNVEEPAIMRDNNAGAPVIDAYYAGSLITGSLGETFNPSFPEPARNPAALPDGIFMANFNNLTLANGNVIRGPVPDVFAHELFHFLGDGRAVQDPISANNCAATDCAHSNDPRNLISAGPNHLSPGMAAGALAAGNPAFAIPATTAVVGPRLSTANGLPGGPPLVGGVDQLTSAQVERIFTEPAVAPYLPAAQKGDVEAAGDRVDWDFVVDQPTFLHDNDANAATPDVRFGLEGLAGQADNHVGADPLFWGIAPTIAPPQPAPTDDNLGHDHRGLAEFQPTPDFAFLPMHDFFRTVDVFSLDAQFADSDVLLPGSGLRSTGESVLDYDLLFLGANDVIVPGDLVTLFIDGWADLQHADDYLARWVSPIPAIGVFIRAHPFGDRGHDGNVQIDAIIASIFDVRDLQVPEPPLFALLLAGGLLLWRQSRPAARSGNTGGGGR